MDIAYSYKQNTVALGGGLLAAAAAADAVLSSLFPQSPFVFGLVVSLTLVGLPLLIAGFIDIRRARCTVLRRWDRDLFLKHVREIRDGEQLRIMNSYVPDIEYLVQELVHVCLREKRDITVKILLFDFVRAPHLIRARMKHRPEYRGDPAAPLRGNVEAFLDLQQKIAEQSAKAKLEVRLYDHLPIGGYYQVGERLMQLAFFYTTHSGNCGPGLFCDGINCNKWRRFAENFDESWELAEDRVASKEDLARQVEVA